MTSNKKYDLGIKTNFFLKNFDMLYIRDSTRKIHFKHFHSLSYISLFKFFLLSIQLQPLDQDTPASLPVVDRFFNQTGLPLYCLNREFYLSFSSKLRLFCHLWPPLRACKVNIGLQSLSNTGEPFSSDQSHLQQPPRAPFSLFHHQASNLAKKQPPKPPCTTAASFP